MSERKLSFYSEEAAKRMAFILGEQCASARALRDAEDRQAKGERVALFIDKKSRCLFVGPYPDELEELAQASRLTPTHAEK